MEQKRFDDLTRALGGASTRRQVLRALAGAAAALLPTSGRAAPCGKEGEQCGCCRGNLTCTNGTCCPNDRVCSGACCPAGHSCQGGACVRSGGGGGSPGGCPPGQASCVGMGCVDITADAANCGACGAVCPASTDPCLVAVCQGGVCGFTAGNDGAACDDRNACTRTDTCSGGFCVGSNLVVCEASDQCHDAGACDPATGLCSDPAKADGTPCSDRNACTNTDTCQQGSCTPGTDVVCQPLDPCHDAGVCDPATGTCSNPQKADGTPCDDGDGCTENAICTAGVCGGGTPVACAGPCEVCAEGACRSTCDDGETCSGGACCPSAKVCPNGFIGTNCCDADQTCTPTGLEGFHACCPAGRSGCFSVTSGQSCCGEGEVCVGRVGQPSRTCCPAARACSDGAGGQLCCPAGQTCCGGVCKDLQEDPANCGACGNACLGDPATCKTARCVGGVCVFTTIANCCQRDDQCGDADPCTVSTCDPHSLTCRHDPISPCCRSDAECAALNSNPCIISTCDPHSHTCRNDPAPDNATCGGGRVCCASSCVNLSEDPDNCGVCGQACVANQPAPAGGCQTGTCFAGACSAHGVICPGCGMPTCDPVHGPVCIGTCPKEPPDACHIAGTGVCQFDGTCTYESICGPCQTCDPNTGNCSPKACLSCETCDPSSGQCVSTCNTPPDFCRTAPGTCNEDGTCSYPEKDCGPCRICDRDSGQCVRRGTSDGTSCGDCRTCLNGQCVISAGAPCGTCQVCNGNGTCQFAPEGTSCGTCQVCMVGGHCVPAAHGISCGDGFICDGSGACVCALTCGPRCCPGGSTNCCVSASPINGSTAYTCCADECIFLGAPGSVCPN